MKKTIHRKEKRKREKEKSPENTSEVSLGIICQLPSVWLIKKYLLYSGLPSPVWPNLAVGGSYFIFLVQHVLIQINHLCFSP